MHEPQLGREKLDLEFLDNTETKSSRGDMIDEEERNLNFKPGIGSWTSDLRI